MKYKGEHIRFWALASERDRVGNRIDYKYRHHEEAPYREFAFDIERIEYTASNTRKARRHVQFHYESIGMPAHVRVWDAFAQTYHRRNVSAVVVGIEMYGPNEEANAGRVWSYSLGYERSADTNRPLLTSIQRCGALGGCLQMRTFQYSRRPPGVKDTYSTIWEHVRDEPIPRERVRVVDANGDGKDDVHVALGLYNSTTVVSADPAQTIASTTVPGPDAVAVDINGDGKPELVSTRTLSEEPLQWEKWIYRADKDGKYAPWKKLPNTEALWDGDPYVTGYNALTRRLLAFVLGISMPMACRIFVASARRTRWRLWIHR